MENILNEADNNEDEHGPSDDYTLDETNVKQLYPAEVEVNISTSENEYLNAQQPENIRDETTLKRACSIDIDESTPGSIGNINRDLTIEENKPFCDIPELPDGKDRYFFISHSSDDSDKVFSIVQGLEQRFNVSCVYADRDFQPGKDISENIKDGITRSLMVLMFLSPKFLRSGFCKLETDFAFMRSIENGASCIIPILLETCEIPITLKALTYIDATCPDTDTPAKIVSALVQGDVGCIPYSETYENGYSVILQAQTTSCIRHCLRIPTKYQFKIDETLLQKLESNKIKVSERLLEQALSTVNQDPVMKSYDYLRRRNIVCWSVLTIPFFVALFFFWLYMTMVICASRTPYSREDLEFINSTFAYLIICLPSVYGFFALLLICVLPIICRRRKGTVRLQKTLLNLYEDEYICNNIIIIFSGRKYKLPTFHIMRYNIKRCSDYLTEVVKKRKSHFTHDAAEIFARTLVHEYLEENCLMLAEDFEGLPERPYNRHSVKKGKMCLCQIIENEIGGLKQNDTMSL